MKSLAVDDHSVVLLQIGGCRQAVILISLVSLQKPELDAVELALHYLLLKVVVATSTQHDMHVRAIGGREIGEPQILGAIRSLVDRCSPTCLVRLALEP